MIPTSTFLTQRERECLELVARGYTFADVANQLLISPYTVAAHIRNVRQKLHASNCTHAVFIALSDAPPNTTNMR